MPEWAENRGGSALLAPFRILTGFDNAEVLEST
jgi:hypothetical protein